MRNKVERSIPLPVLPAHVEQAIPQREDACTMACAMKAIGLADVKMSYDVLSGDVYAHWEASETDPVTGLPRQRIFTAVVEPLRQAIQVLTANDLDRARLLKVLPADGWTLSLTHVQSRWKQNNRKYASDYKRPGPGHEGTRKRTRRTRSRMAAMSSE